MWERNKTDYTLALGFKGWQETRLRVGKMLNNDLYLFLWHLFFSALPESISSGFHNTLSRRYSREILRTLKNIFSCGHWACRKTMQNLKPGSYASQFRASGSMLFSLQELAPKIQNNLRTVWGHVAVTCRCYMWKSGGCCTPCWAMYARAAFGSSFSTSTFKIHAAITESEPVFYQDF